MKFHALVGLVCLACFTLHTDASKIHLFDSVNGGHLLSGPEISLSAEGIATAAAALAGLVPPHGVQHQVSTQIEALLKPTVFDKPRAVVLLSLLGVDADSSQVQDAFKGRTSRSVQLISGTATSSLIEVLSDLSSANPDLSPIHLDHTSLQGCNEVCLEQHLRSALQLLTSATYSAVQGKPLSGAVTFTDGTTLQLTQQACKLWAMELAALYASAQQQHSADGSAQVYESTIISIQALAQAHGKASAQVRCAQSALLAVLAHIAQQLDQQHSGQVVYQVALLGDAPVHSAGPAQLLQWKQVTRRSLLQDVASASAEEEEAAAARQFSAKAAAYGGAVILLYFGIAAVYCMCNMNIKQDTLLYTRAKVD